MNEPRDFLLEIGCAELPSRSLTPLVLAIEKNLCDALKKTDLPFDSSTTIVTPRRLAVLVKGLAVKQLPRDAERQGPSVAAAYDNEGLPTLAFMGFARSCGVSIDEVEVKETPKGKYLCFKEKKPGEETATLLPDVIKTALSHLPIPKPMRWGANDNQFIRPVHWALALFGRQVIPVKVFGVLSDRITYGHRFHHPDAIQINEPCDYVSTLKRDGFVIADFSARKEAIREQIKTAVTHVGTAIIDANLLTEVTGLVEWPVALVGSFSRRYLEVPREALIKAMNSHQKCFAVESNAGKLEPYFVLVSNIESRQPDIVIKGNERVINARLSDAAFFYEKDCQTTLDSHLERLASVVFQQKLGSLADKVSRVTRLSGHIAKSIQADLPTVKRASQLAKCDLVTDMVGEFPSLQGIMGGYYAKHQGETEAVAGAITAHYQPRFSGDVIPSTAEGQVVALADKLDTLVGIIGIKQMPTGDKDPFALRRAAIGIVRIIIEGRLDIDLNKLIAFAQKGYDALPNPQTQTQCFDFCMDRLKAWYSEQGVDAHTFAAVRVMNPTNPLDFDQRIKAVCAFKTLPEAKALSAANKRVSNILKKSTDPIPKKTDAALFDDGAEKALAAMLATQSSTVTSLTNKGDYTAALNQLSSLKEPVDDFFEAVMIMDENQKKRKNRLALLASLRALFSTVADISQLSS